MRMVVDHERIDRGSEAVRRALSSKLARPAGSPWDQPLAVDALGFLSLQVVLPVIVSLCSSYLYDVLKGLKASALREKQLRDIMKAFEGLNADTDSPLSAECLDAIAELLAPLGFTRNEILGLYRDVSQAMGDGGTVERPPQERPNQVPEDTARKLADPQH